MHMVTTVSVLSVSVCLFFYGLSTKWTILVSTSNLLENISDRQILEYSSIGTLRNFIEFVLRGFIARSVENSLLLVAICV